MKKSKVVVLVLTIILAVTLIVMVETSRLTDAKISRENLGVEVQGFSGVGAFWNVSILATNYGDSPVQINNVSPYPVNVTGVIVYCNGTQLSGANYFSM